MQGVHTAELPALQAISDLEQHAPDWTSRPQGGLWNATGAVDGR